LSEIWKSVKGFEGCYEVSSYGRVRSLDRMILNKNNKYQKANGRILKGKVNKLGYVEVVLYDKNRKASYPLVHRILTQTFISNPDNKPQVNHKNGVKNDNRLENLEWSTIKENIKHALETRLTKVGSDRSDSKLTDSQVLEIRELFATKKYSFSELGRMFNVDGSGIGRIVKGLKWKHLPVIDYDFDIDSLERKRRKYTLKLSDSQIEEVFRMVGSGVSRRKVAEHFGVTHTTINRIIKEKAL
jgi:DNA-binding MarR family transcriptional regulator